MSTNKYFQSELDNLRGLAREFATENPTLAPQLASTSTDPDVERILEGTAFLTASIRQKIDDDFPEFAQGLLKHIFPHYLKPLPCATIMQFRPRNILKNRIDVKAGTYIDSADIEGIQCRFRTTRNITVWPMKIGAASLSETSTGRKMLTLEFEFNGVDIHSFNQDEINIYLGGDFHIASDLFYILHNKVDAIDLSTTGTDLQRAGDCYVEAGGFDQQDALLQHPSHAFPVYRLIQEYFLLRDKFLFIRLKGFLSTLKGFSGSRFRMHFTLKEGGMKMPRISASNFMLHAVPAINLFEHDAVSIQNDFKHFEYAVKPIRNNLQQYHVYSVDDVMGQNRKTASKSHYRLAGLANPDSISDPVYQVSEREEAGFNESWISFSYPPGMDLDQQEILQLKLTCSNGELPAKLREGDINKPTANTSELVEFSNLIRPSEYQHSPSGQSLLWRLLSHLSLNYLSLADTENFKSLLGLYIFSSASGSKQEAINRKKIDGIVSVSVKPGDRLVQGIAMRGQTIELRVNSMHFASRGDMYMFGLLADKLFASFASLNSYTELVMTDENTDETYEFQVKTGDKPLI
jgi:type VI secretion system protein ImpG